MPASQSALITHSPHVPDVRSQIWRPFVAPAQSRLCLQPAASGLRVRFGAALRTGNRWNRHSVLVRSRLVASRGFRRDSPKTIHRPCDFFWWEEFVQSETDRFRRIQIRALLGTGPRFALFETHKWLNLYVGLAYMLEYTSIDPSAVILEPALVHRLSSYVALTMHPDDRIVFTTVSYYQPRFDEWTDAHFLNVSSVEFKVTPLLSSRIDATTRYESVVPLGVKRADLEFKSSLELKF